MCRDHVAAANLVTNLDELGVGFYRSIFLLSPFVAGEAPVERCLASAFAKPTARQVARPTRSEPLGIPLPARGTELEVCGAKARPKDFGDL